MADKLSSAQQRAVAFIKAKRAGEYGALGIEIGKLLAEITVELADAKDEAAHWKRSFDTVMREFKLAVAIAARKNKDGQFVVKQGDFISLPQNSELHVDSSDPTMRIYSVRPRASEIVSHAVERALKPH